MSGSVVPVTLYAQSTTGSVYGSVTAAQGDNILIQGAGVNRVVSIDASGRYSMGSLPVGTYKLTLRKGDQIVSTRSDVELRVNTGTEVSFGDAAELGTVTVHGTRSAALDMSSVSSSSVVTARELAILPVGRSAEAIALLAPGAIQSAGVFTGPTGTSLVSLGGASVTENAYYINGLNTTDPISGFGGITLPYGAIDQQEVLTGGYGAQYGRADGGVISQVGKRGTDEWHYGFSAEWTPASLRSDQTDIYYPNNGRTTDGKIYQRRSGSSNYQTRYSAYAGGPLIADRLYFFGAIEGARQAGNSVASTSYGYNTEYAYTDPKAYVKLDWHINDNNLLEFTGIKNKHQYSGIQYDYDSTTGTTGDFLAYDTHTKVNATDWVSKWTSYLTDDLTFTAQYGRQRVNYASVTPGLDNSLTYVSNITNQNLALTPDGEYVSSAQTSAYADNTSKVAGVKDLRLELNWKLGNHDITVGIDNHDTYDYNDGDTYSGSGYIWSYGYDTSGAYLVGDDSSSTVWVDPVPASANGYYVSKVTYSTSASVEVRQRAQYIQDNWQFTDNLLLSLGLRNDQFTNYNSDGQAYVRLTTPQWAPRLGFSWDVKGDQSMRIYGNAGRYYLAMPTSVALRGASGSLYTTEYFTYTGIDSNGIPTGLTAIDSSTGGAVSANNEYGQAPDAATVAASSLEAQYQDEYMLGFGSKLGDTSWVYGAKATYRQLKNAIEDTCDMTTLSAVATEKLGYDVDLAADGYGCLLFNPGKTNTFRVANSSGGYDSFTVTSDELGMGKAKRNYKALELFLERPFDGKWYAKVDYVWSKLQGNTEGQVNSNTGQDDVSMTVDFDYARLMEYSNGYLANDRRHTLKAYGSYQLTDEWLLGANLTVASGTPKTCLGYYGTDQSAAEYGTYYHWCAGKPSPTGSAGRFPWSEILSLSAEYRPEWGKKRLAFTGMVYNVLDQQRVTRWYPYYGTSSSVNASYGRTMATTAPRYFRFGVQYDF
ncbi:TonB-dependent receptor [Pseudoxanthomonas sp.]|uniref:TonB-dependent receptor n=1 Tax=Pseudoxanthomonas sp. TaxID=1871049 RepID=UPI00261D904A|nr:TonB-dependent receptor [Pseudoxanthomonas sp.]WDS36161.1 MAG: TonB-dependent receptor [Pseudoxanthomonas sp.]